VWYWESHLLFDVISTVVECMVRVLHPMSAIGGFAMLCEVISAVTEFMVRVLHLRSGVGNRTRCWGVDHLTVPTINHVAANR
jgi:hypothetical protein